MFTLLEQLPWISRREFEYDGMNKIVYELPYGYYLHVAFTYGVPTIICSFMRLGDPILLDETSEEQIYSIVNMTLRGIDLPLKTFRA